MDIWYYTLLIAKEAIKSTGWGMFKTAEAGTETLQACLEAVAGGGGGGRGKPYSLKKAL